MVTNRTTTFLQIRKQVVDLSWLCHVYSNLLTQYNMNPMHGWPQICSVLHKHSLNQFHSFLKSPLQQHVLGLCKQVNDLDTT